MRTRLFGESVADSSATLSEIAASTTAPSTSPADTADGKKIPTRLVTGENQRGVLRDVLQPGIYYLNPRLFKVDILPIGYDAITLEHPLRPGQQNTSVRFLSSDGYQIEAKVPWTSAVASSAGTFSGSQATSSSMAAMVSVSQARYCRVQVRTWRAR